MLEFIDGFDHYTTNAQVLRKWDATSSTGAIPATGRFAGNSLNIYGSNTFAIVTLGAQQTRICGFAFEATGSASNTIIAQFMDSGTTQLELRQTTSGALTVTRNGTVLATSSFVLSLSVWYYVEFKATIDPSAGAYEVRVNGTAVLSGSGANTRNTANSSANQLRINSNGVSGGNYFDDLYILNPTGSANNDFLGECRILTNLPNAEGTTEQWTPSTGTVHYSLVNESNPNDDTNYVSSSTAGQIDTYQFASISPSGSIAAAQIVFTARKDDAGTRQLVVESRSGGTNRDGATTQTMNSNYLMYREIYETDPNTSAAWTTANLNSAEFGAKVVA